MTGEFRDLASFVKHLNELGYRHPVVIDVGVAWGTPELYDGFPDAYFILVEAVAHFEDSLKRILKRVRGEYHLFAVGDRLDEFEVSIELTSRSLATSNVLDMRKGRAGVGAIFAVTVKTLDSIVKPENVPSGSLLKTDVQAGDLRALHGAVETLRNCEVVIVEGSIHNPKNLVRDIVNFMDDRGFQLYDLLSPLYRPYDKALGQVDLAFARKGCALVAYPGWA